MKRVNSGIALLTVLVVLVIFSVFTAAFVQTIRVEIETTRNISSRQIVSDSSSNSSSDVVETQRALLDGADQLTGTGDENRPYVSFLDSWYLSGWTVSGSERVSTYDSRRFAWNTPLQNQISTQINQNNETVLRLQNGRFWESLFYLSGEDEDSWQPYPGGFFFNTRGVDEDPEGILLTDEGGLPGFAGVDDNGDGKTDLYFEQGDGLASDDDEDGSVDEDPVDLRGSLVENSLLSPPFGTLLNFLPVGWDSDQDALGMDAATSRLNINVAGNAPAQDAGHSYHHCTSPAELDLEVMVSLTTGTAIGEALAREVIRQRNGQDHAPGYAGFDDDGNQSDTLLGSLPSTNANLVPGDSLDNDSDGLTDEEDEVPAWSSAGSSASIPGDRSDNKGNLASVLSDGVDNGGYSGVIDDVLELDTDGDGNPRLDAGIDDLSEQNAGHPFGDDTPFKTGEEIRRLLVDEVSGEELRLQLKQENGQFPTAYGLLSPFITTKSSAPRMRQDAPSEPVNNRRKLNPNLILEQLPDASQVFSPEVFLSLAALDNDGDWDFELDRNANQIPDGDWDGEGEQDQTDNIDEDFDQQPDDDGKTDSRQVYYTPERETGGGYEGSGIDDDQPRYETASPLPSSATDGIDQNGNSLRWLADGLDNDRDGLTDESRVDEFRDLITGNHPRSDEVSTPQDAWLLARSEGVDEDGEWVYTPTEAATGVVDLPDLPFLSNLLDSIDYSIDDNINDGATELSCELPAGTTITCYGNEAVRITEILARPFFRIQGETSIADGADWSLEQDPTGAGQYHQKNGPGTTTFVYQNIPSGEFYLIVNQYFDPDPDNRELMSPDDFGLPGWRTPLTTGDEVYGDLGGVFEQLSYYAELTIPGGALSLQTSTVEIRQTLDSLDAYAPGAQFIEIANFGEKPVDLSGWEFRAQLGDTNNSDLYASRIGNGSYLLDPGQFAVVFPATGDDEDSNDVANDGPARIAALKPIAYAGGIAPLVIVKNDLIATGDFPLALSRNMGEAVYGQDALKVLEVRAPLRVDEPDGETVLMDRFYYNLGADFCAPNQAERRQDEFSMLSQHRGDPTQSVLYRDVTSENHWRYIHAPHRFLVADAVRAPTTAATCLGWREPSGVVIDSVTTLNRTETGEPLVDITAPVIIDFPGLFNHFRDPATGEGAILHLVAGGVSTAAIGSVTWFDPISGNPYERTTYHGDEILPPIDLNDLAAYTEPYTDAGLEPPFTIDPISNEPDGLSIALTPALTGQSYFAYLEVSPVALRSDGVANEPRIGADPGREAFFFPHPEENESTAFYMARYRNLPSPVTGDRTTYLHERSLQFREGPLHSVSPYMAGRYGRNLEKYSMGRGVFSGPTPLEMTQIAERIDLHPDPTVEGLINLNTADVKVLAALPFFPPESPNVGTVEARMALNAVLANAIAMGRSERGFDGEIGLPDVDDDGDGLADVYDTGVPNPQLADGLWRWDSAVSDVRNIDNDIRDTYAPKGWTGLGFGQFGVDDGGNGKIDDIDEYRRIPNSDDGPYRTIGGIAKVLLNPYMIGVLEQYEASTGYSLRPANFDPDRAGDVVAAPDISDLYIMLGRALNLATVQSNEFVVKGKAQILEYSPDPEKRAIGPEVIAVDVSERIIGR